MSTATMEARRFVRLAQGAARTGMSVSTLRKWIRARRLRAYQPAGCKILVDVRELDDLVLASARTARA